ncbi:FUSC family protein [Lysobacter niastensis]|uniref:FUSC family protein n=1 Tax=Lysobacter niastensis TaxID=380629 RepID=A0ABS0B7Y1_9GAMM|nr:aromatic acid exporter family protein [Lysobacter niastensis]MBF6023827.1 FUSC family protein [Lysobacter niastensis]
MFSGALKLADLQLSLRAAIAAGLAVVVADLLRLPYPIYAMISAVLVTDLSPLQTRRLGWPRLVATVMGTGIGASMNALLPSGLWTVAFGVAAAMLLSQLLRMRHAAKVAGYICGIVLLDHGEQPWAYAVVRMVETLLGIGAAMLVSLVPKLVEDKEPTP